ncbi:MAG: maltodextrin glucosidase, partial [Anaerolineae bacterium]|nr:maltodextrin glucosidase [Anaerolineae bacterium]
HKVYLRTFPDGEQHIKPLTLQTTSSPVSWWGVELPIAEPTVHYRFILEAEDGIWFYSAAGPSRAIPTDATDFRILAGYTPPAWVMESVFYQIFPDRFANGDPANDPQPEDFEYKGFRPQVYPWGEPLPDGLPHSVTFFGGDLQGIQQHLDYLEALGVNALYLNPVFTAHTNHKYDVIDYEHVDPHFGGDAALEALSTALHARGIRYLLDIVPNHCGYWHPWFQKALKDAAAPEAGYFTFRDHPKDYESWLGVWLLPKLNYNNEELRRVIYQDQDAIFRRWLRPPFAIDGWRIDVGNMLGRQGATQLGRTVAQGIRQAVKETRAEAYLLGENFFDGTNQLQGDQWDAIMNYQGLTIPLQYWTQSVKIGAQGLPRPITSITHWTTGALVQSWTNIRAAVPWVMALQQFNVLGTHDTPRWRTLVDGNEALLRLAAIIQFTYPGIPCLYYGDEIGMVDQPDVGPRGCMIWDESKWDHEILAFYRKLIALRRHSPVLQRGGFQVLAIEKDCLAYQRESIAGRILVIAQRASAPRPAGPLPVAHGGIADGTRFVEHFSGQEIVVEDGVLNLTEHPQGATLWVEVKLLD